MSQRQPRRERVASGQRRHFMFADIPRRSRQRANQSARKNSSSLQCIETKNLARMSRVRTPIINNVKNFRAHNPAQNDQDAKVPRQFPVNPLLLRIAHTDPQSDQHPHGHQKSIGRQIEIADMKKSGKHLLILDALL